ncbi:ABC transporter substrate-binding protein [Agromyces ramosus]|uniref:Raffinose/stachyose/melibiose transport system substrate-binding protein n=1 Tax=Agromyces ramosus TaxID=33879 RepID=A0ABU0RAD3_9MICO|nr:extracellular solute-binding protein [Agromyces ramosus]MDQ0895030.1 raffinose/stachyose/melibiose transport system substrate-binding protein [Agromyces ramosus]
MTHSKFGRAVVIATIAAGSMTLGACNASGTEDAAGEIVITCATCQESPTDPFLQYNYEAAQRFNEEFEGTYRIETLSNANAGSGDERLQYYQRLALADDLPDVFQLNSAEIAALSETGSLHDFTDDLASDSAWADSFQPGTFDALTGAGGEVWAIPQQRDPIGIYYNKDLWAEAGYDELPSTWNEFEDGARAIAATGTIPLALDGDWATMLMWTNLIGTAPGGQDFLTEGIAGSNYVDDEAAYNATERLRDWHVEGLVNSDAFSGEFQNAAAAYLSGSAATVPNGPWFVKTNLQGDAAIDGLYESTGYSVSPGWDDGQGLVVVSGAGWVSGTEDQTELEAVLAFLRFVSSEEEVIVQAEQTGANPAVIVDEKALEAADLEPLSSALVTASNDVAQTYPHVRVHGPAGFGNAWKNLWPAYVQGDIDTDAFLTRLAEDANAGGEQP